MSHQSPSPIGSDRPSRLLPDRASMKRLHGRITKDDIRSARLRRWNGRDRVTTDWVNLYQEPELCFSSGNLLVYLRQTGQSSRGPAFRIHTSHLQARGFHSLLKQCRTAAASDRSRGCLQNSCPGCDKHEAAAELYIPAPPLSGMDATFDHHITTRNFFAWLYDLPLAGRSLGVSLVALRKRIDTYRGGPSTLTDQELVKYVDSQKYLDFRECVDHALAAMTLAEVLHKEDLWSDAFAHAVGMSHRDIDASIEYPSLSSTSKRLLLDSRLEMDVRLARASLSIETFFGDDLSGNFLGLHQAAREHFDRFRSFLHAFYIEQYGFWPPAGFSNESTRYSIYASIYSDFRNLYHHLVDAEASSLATELTSSGGVCTLQNIRAFDDKHGFETLPRPLPCLPVEPSNTVRTPTLQRRRSWNPVMQKKIDRECRNTLRVQALIDASNRDMIIMECPIVRRYSEFESQSVADDLEHVSWIDGRKVRWVLVYAILQTLISIMAAPKAVRNTDRLSYPLCCRIPDQLPWQKPARPSDRPEKTPELVPDIHYINKNASTTSLDNRASRSTTRKERRQSVQSLPQSPLTRSFSLSRAPSLRRLLSRKRSAIEEPVPPMPAAKTPFCEILVQGYGNGLNDVKSSKASLTALTIPVPERGSKLPATIKEVEPKRQYSQMKDATRTVEIREIPDVGLSSVSRESSNRSSNSAWSKSSVSSIDEVRTPVDADRMSQLADLLKSANIKTPTAHVQVYEEIDFEGSIHINTKTWDEILG